ncbi:hypothetical protein JCM1841_000988 [Sporobolomyces salmonicolor]
MATVASFSFAVVEPELPSPAKLSPPTTPASIEFVPRFEFDFNEPASPQADHGAKPEEEDPRMRGTIGSVRGGVILGIACCAQLLDNVFMNSVNIALPTIQRELDISTGNLQWLVSAYTLTFGGFLLLAGVCSDRYGKRVTFVTGMLWLAGWSLGVSFAQSEITLIIFRALQGLGAAATVPSAIGALSSYFVGRDSHRAMSCFGAAGAIGFVLGLVLGGLLTGTIGWRWVFRITSPVIAVLGILAIFFFPPDKPREGDRKPALDLAGAALGTSAMILLTFALSSSESYGWKKAIVLAPLLISVAVLGGFVMTERRVQNPVMPLSLWKLPSFAAIWLAAFMAYCWWGSLNYYMVLICQDVLGLSPLATAVRFVPEGVVGFIVSIATGYFVERVSIKVITLAGLGISIAATIPVALMTPESSFWAKEFVSSVLGVIGISLTYNVLTIALVGAVPPGAKSLAGGLVNTAFQIGSAVGLALCGVVQGSVVSKSDTSVDQTPAELMKGYSAALWMGMGLVGFGFVISAFDTTNDVNDFLLFLQELRAKIGTDKLISADTLSTGCIGSDGSLSTDLSAFGDVLDFNTIMTYDSITYSSKTTGPNFAYSSSCAPSDDAFAIPTAVQEWITAKFPADKIMLGLASYGYAAYDDEESFTVKGGCVGQNGLMGCSIYAGLTQDPDGKLAAAAAKVC